MFGIEDLSFEWQYSLSFSVTTLLRRTSRGISLYDVYLGLGWILAGTIRELPGKGHPFESSLANNRIAGASGSGTSSCCEEGFFHHRFRRSRILLKVFVEFLWKHSVYHELRFGIYELLLGLGTETRIRNLDGYDRTKPFEYIRRFEIGVFFLQYLLFAGVFIDSTSQCCLKPCHMRSSVGGRHIVYETDDTLRVIVFLVLKSDLHLDIVEILVCIEDTVPDGVNSSVEVMNVGLNPSFEEESVFRSSKLIRESQGNPLREICLLSETSQNRIIVEYNGREHGSVRPESNDSSMDIGFLTGWRSRTVWNTALVRLRIHLFIFMNPNLHLVGKSIYHRCSYSMETSGYLVPALRSSELSSGVKHRHNRLKSGFTRLWVDIYGNTATIIPDRYGSVRVHGNRDMFRMTRHRLIDGVINNLPNEVMKSLFVGLPDVHTGSFSYRLKTLKNLYITTIVRCCRHNEMIWLKKLEELYGNRAKSKGKKQKSHPL
ncbi:MAG: hypothetical protein ACD_78C00047G0003 [uncultured bacterium (gcode 4)]|uniref:Uncharacterized protein n=1 Tax=uncultured bacterium (gcode 4) TaxID=1234023 RepID=K1YDZ0_9BACT|nr:MAG: hypothetical protein ACD_78C00047G0003 [uncultured bacterium (gcode 4)]